MVLLRHHPSHLSATTLHPPQGILALAFSQPGRSPQLLSFLRLRWSLLYFRPLPIHFQFSRHCSLCHAIVKPTFSGPGKLESAEWFNNTCDRSGRLKRSTFCRCPPPANWLSSPTAALCKLRTSVQRLQREPNSALFAVKQKAYSYPPPGAEYFGHLLRRSSSSLALPISPPICASAGDPVFVPQEKVQVFTS